LWSKLIEQTIDTTTKYDTFHGLVNYCLLVSSWTAIAGKTTRDEGWMDQLM
jgi:hypothetical protein